MDCCRDGEYAYCGQLLCASCLAEEARVNVTIYPEDLIPNWPTPRCMTCQRKLKAPDIFADDSEGSHTFCLSCLLKAHHQ